MRARPSSRLLIVDGEGRVLLFRFAFTSGPLAGQSWWATPGGGLDPGESFEDAAVRELFEETGLRVSHPGPQIAVREAVFQVPDGEWVRGDERFFLIRVGDLALSRDGWTDLERQVMTDHRWWTAGELRDTSD